MNDTALMKIHIDIMAVQYNAGVTLLLRKPHREGATK